MADGQHHSGMSKGIASGIGLGAISSYFLTPIEISFIAIGCLFGIVMTPDLDSDNGFIGDWYIRRVFRKPGLLVWNIIWSPYRVALKHRSFWSHTPVIGTTVRLLFCFCPCIILLLKDQNSTKFYELIPKVFLSQMVVILPISVVLMTIYFLYMNTQIDLLLIGLSLFSGLCISDFGHWVLDM